jgi:hypothetical protein
MAHDNQNNTILDDMNNYDWVRDSWVAPETESCYYCVNCLQVITLQKKQQNGLDNHINETVYGDLQSELF